MRQKVLTCCMGSKIGVMKIAAKRCGLSLEDYSARLLAGEKWCTRCKAWHTVNLFGADKSRSDGLTAQCLLGRNLHTREAYKPRPRPLPGRHFVAVRDDDRKQARRRVNFLVESGLLPRPDCLPCADCKRIGPGVRHEYDHHLGYAAEHHEQVQCVCFPCHRRRETIRKLES
jgi:hypothetical protein